MNLMVWQKSAQSLSLTEEHVKTFASLTGDYNPLHFDESFAAKTKFKKLVLRGGLTIGLLHPLVAMGMTGLGTVFLSQNWKFTAPVLNGDTISTEAEVMSIHESKPVTELKINVNRQNGETVLEREVWCYTFSDEEKITK